MFSSTYATNDAEDESDSSHPDEPPTFSVRAFDDVAEPVAKSKPYRPEKTGYNWTSHADNLVAEPEDLWLAYWDD